MTHNPSLATDFTSFEAYAMASTLARIVAVGRFSKSNLPYPTDTLYPAFTIIRAIQPETVEPICSGHGRGHRLWKEAG